MLWGERVRGRVGGVLREYGDLAGLPWACASKVVFGSRGSPGRTLGNGACGCGADGCSVCVCWHCGGQRRGGVEVV